MTLSERKERVKEIIIILEKIEKEKDTVIKIQYYDQAAKLLDDYMKCIEELEDLMNPKEKDEN